MDLKEVKCSGVDWTYLSQDRDYWQVFVNTVMNLQGHKGGKFLD
jgi:hypothetical protein